MTWETGLTIVGSFASIVGAAVAIKAANKSRKAKSAAESARDEVKKALANHHTAEALSEAKQAGLAAINALVPFYSPGKDSPKGASVDKALEKLAEFTFKLSEASSQFPSGKKTSDNASNIVRRIDQIVINFRAEKNPTEATSLLNLIFTETRGACALVASELNESRRNV